MLFCFGAWRSTVALAGHLGRAGQETLITVTIVTSRPTGTTRSFGLRSLWDIRDGLFGSFRHYVIAGSSQRDRRSASLAIPFQALRYGRLDPRAISKVHAANLHDEFAAWFAAQALYCASRRVAAVSVFPEGWWWSPGRGTNLLGSIARVPGTSEATMTPTGALDTSCSSSMRIRCAPSTFSKAWTYSHSWLSCCLNLTAGWHP